MGQNDLIFHLRTPELLGICFAKEKTLIRGLVDGVVLITRFHN